MPRTKEFDQETVLTRAMDIFWQKGFEATSMQDLVDRMEINRQSIYDTFGDKHALFLKAVDHYQREIGSKMVALLGKPGSALANIRELFSIAVEQCSSDKSRRGCLLANTAIELSPHCKQTNQKISSSMKRMEKAFASAIERGQTAGEIPANKDAPKLAGFLLSNLQGLMVIAKVNPDRKQLGDIVETTLSALT